MARVATPLLNLGKWLDGEHPGSGPQDGTLSDGLNGDKNKLDVAVGTGHNADGSHKAAVIDAANLKSTVADGSTIEQDGSSKKLKVKDAGISTAKLADDSVTMAKVASDVAGAGLKQNTDGSLSPDVDGSTVTVVGGKLTATVPQVVTITATCITGVTPTIPLPAGEITRIVCTNDDGDISAKDVSITVVSADSALLISGATGTLNIRINGTIVDTILLDSGFQFVMITMSI